MAFRLADALQRSLRATLKFQGAPDPASIPREQRPGFAEKQAAFQERQASKARLSARRRMRGRPGIRGPFGFTSGGKAPLGASTAAELVSGQLGTPFADEFNRFTAPDPEAFARGARAPEFISNELDLGRAGVSAAELENQASTARLPFIAPGLQQEQDVLGQQLTEAEAEAERTQELFGPQLETAQQVPQLGQLEIADLERRAAVQPLPETVLAREEKDRAFELAQRETGVQTAEQQRLLDRIDSQIETARLEGDLDKVDRLERQAQDIVTGFTGPRAPEPGTLGGAPGIPRRGISPIAQQRLNAQVESQSEAAGLPGAQAMLDDVGDDLGLPSRLSIQKLKTAVVTIRDALAAAPNEAVRDRLRLQIRNTPAYVSIKARATGGGLNARYYRGQFPEAVQELFDLIDGPTEPAVSVGGAPPIQTTGATGTF